MADIRATTPGAKSSAYPLQPNATYLGEVKMVYPDNTVGIYVKKLSSTFSRCKVVGSPLLQPLLKGDKVVCGLLDGLKQELVVYGRYDTTGATNAVSLNSEGTIDLSGNIMISAGNTLAFEGSTNDIYETTVTVVDPTADRTITLPNVSGTVITTGNLSGITSTGTLSSLNITGALSVDTSTFNVDAINNRVGVGTASPSTALQVIGTVTATAFAGTLTGNVTGNVSGTAATVTGNAQSAITSVGTLTGLTLSGTVTLPNSVNNQIYTSTTADSALPWANGPVLQGATGWSFYSAISASYRMGFRSNTAGTSKYFWTADSALIGEQPNDFDVTNTLNVMGTGRFTGAVTATSFNVDATHYLYAVSGEYGSIQVTGNKNTYAGYSIDGNAVFMSNGSTFGLYDDTNNQWFMHKDFAGESRFYYAGVERILIKSDGVSIRGSSSGTGANGTLNAYAYYGNSNVAGTGSASYHPSGIYSTGTNWLYGTMYLNANSIDGLGSISLAANNAYQCAALPAFGFNAWDGVSSYNFYNASDIRYKQNIKSLPLGIEFLKLLNPIEFTYLYPQFDEDSETPTSIMEGSRLRAGLSAQNVKEALNAIGVGDYNFWALANKDDANSFEALDYTGLVAPIIQAIKEMDATITLLKQQIETLENK
jgi:hypothetical protein